MLNEVIEKNELAIYLNETKTNQIPTKDSGYYLDREKSKCSDGAIINWNINAWNPEIKNITKTGTKCSLYFIKFYREGILNGTDPVVKGSLIPIKLANEGVVTKADMKLEWYNYANKEWANAVILKDETITYNNGDIIPESNIESYFVWIPRYRYKIFNEGNYVDLTVAENKVQTIEIEFENKDTLRSNGTKVGEWLTHPAFTAFDTNGMWVGKYETSKSSGSDNERNGEAIQIKPNVSSWRNIQVGNAFYTSYDYKRDLESHMMKNTEWGAVAYLHQSKYGSEASVRINNNSNYVTGYAANNEPTCGYTATNEECNKYCNDGTCNQPFNTETGYLASTTSNITGIYDMAGGRWEFVMSVMKDQHGNPMSGRNSSNHSGFKGTLGCPTCDNDTSGITSITNGYDWPDAKYYDVYSYSGVTRSFNMRILGDATGEMGPFGNAMHLTQTRSIGSWHKDFAIFINSGNPWFYRGGGYSNGNDTGVFSFYSLSGSSNSGVSFRVVLTP